jgi:hypothetical protein
MKRRSTFVIDAARESLETTLALQENTVRNEPSAVFGWYVSPVAPDTMLKIARAAELVARPYRRRRTPRIRHASK